MEDGIAAWFRTGAGAGASLMHAVVAEAHLARGDLATADGRLAEAEAMIAKTGERFYEAEILRLRGEILLRRESDPAAGLASFARGLELARAQSAAAWELRLANGLAARLIADGRPEAARKLLSDCVGRFDEGLDSRDLAIARRLLAECA
jgi:tetratricopeptide (TPR) repeat protein